MQLIDWLTLAYTPGIGPVACRRLLDHFGTIEAALSAGDERCRLAGLRDDSCRALRNGISRQKAEEELHRCEKQGVRLLGWDDPLFPPLLREIADPPLVLYIKGDATLLSRRPALAIVGARAATSYGQKIAADLAGSLTRHDFTVVSGLALGIDRAAHQGACRAGGNTIAVLGCGVDVPYPVQNQSLYNEIAAQGAIVSDYPLATQPEAFRFPARNRIISGLCRGVVVIEAATRSGSLITAKLALEQGREVFAVPGRVDSPKSEGCHRLIRDGAVLVHSVADIIAELEPAMTPRPATMATEAASAINHGLSREEQCIVSCLEAYPKDIDTIINATRLPAQRVSTLLLGLELKGLVASGPGQQYHLALGT